MRRPTAAGCTCILSPEIAGELKWAGFDMLSHANNHAFDYGSTAVLETLSMPEKAGLVIAGSGKDLQAARAPRYFRSRGPPPSRLSRWHRRSCPTARLPLRSRRRSSTARPELNPGWTLAPRSRERSSAAARRGRCRAIGERFPVSIRRPGMCAGASSSAFGSVRADTERTRLLACSRSTREANLGAIAAR